MISPQENAMERKSPLCLSCELEDTSPNKTGNRARVQELIEATAPANATAMMTSIKFPLKSIFWIYVTIYANHPNTRC